MYHLKEMQNIRSFLFVRADSSSFLNVQSHETIGFEGPGVKVAHATTVENKNMLLKIITPPLAHYRLVR